MQKIRYSFVVVMLVFGIGNVKAAVATVKAKLVKDKAAVSAIEQNWDNGNYSNYAVYARKLIPALNTVIQDYHNLVIALSSSAGGSVPKITPAQATVSKVPFSSSSPVQGVITPTTKIINELNPVSVTPSLEFINVGLTNKENSGWMVFRFGKKAIAQMLKQTPTLLSDGLLISAAVTQQGGQYYAQVNLTDMNGVVYATGQQLTTVNLDFMNIGFNIDDSQLANPTATTNPSTALNGNPIGLGQQVLYQQGTNTTPIYQYVAPNYYANSHQGPGFSSALNGSLLTACDLVYNLDSGSSQNDHYLTKTEIDQINAALKTNGPLYVSMWYPGNGATLPFSVIYTIYGNNGSVVLTGSFTATHPIMNNSSATGDVMSNNFWGLYVATVANNQMTGGNLQSFAQTAQITA